MNEKSVALKSISIGDKVKVKRLLASGGIRRRLQDIGVIEGTEIECLHKSPSGDPIAYMIRGAVMALRSEESSQIIVEGCEDYVG
ncbi:MAG: ferrous iron transport protein A [Clostridiales bacterium]|jgi:ferrous iron transport protein A|nr:ferrous iron transport protein A [Clostridiales bacterium]